MGAAPAWRAFQVLTLVAVGWAGWRLLGHTPYRIDIDVYRMGGRAWLDGTPLYSDQTVFHTLGGIDLPFTYPPLAAIVFAPFAWLPLPAASATITAITFLLLMVSTWIVLTRLRIWDVASRVRTPAWARRAWLAAAIVAPTVVYFEPIRANFEFGQINVVLMTLVIADLVPRKPPWPRGLLLGIGVALKLTPAVFVLYLLLRKDVRAIVVTAASTLAATLVGLLLAFRDSVQYWSVTVHDTDRIGTATLNTNQNIAGTLARLGVGDASRFALWVAACFAVLAVTVWAGRRLLRGRFDEAPVLTLVCVAMFGLVVSPVSWSHHWVWMLPAILVLVVVAYRYRDAALAAVSACGVALMVWTPITLLTPHRETAAPLWRQLAGSSYLWFALLLILVAGGVAGRLARVADSTPPPVTAPEGVPPVPAANSN